MTSRFDAERAVNQLLCLTMGTQIARDSNHLHNDLYKRIQHCRKLVQDDLRKAADAPNVEAVVTTVQRKLTSLQSLETLSKLINEVEW
jgi:predicted transcriptional regulator